MKTCPKCLRELPEAEFSRDRSRLDGHYPYCKACADTARRRYGSYAVPWDQWTPEKQEAKVARARELRYRKTYGITIEDYERMLAYQGGGCAICGAKPKTRRLHVDHDHQTGLVRGLLCFQCNALMLQRKANADRLDRAADYLRCPPAVVALGREVFGLTGPTNARRRRKRRTRRRK